MPYVERLGAVADFLSLFPYSAKGKACCVGLALFSPRYCLLSTLSITFHLVSTPNNCITFFVDGQLFGIPAVEVMELSRAHALTPVPLAPPTIAGLMNLRGQVVTAVDMRCRMNLRPRPEGQTPMNVMLRRADMLVSLLVDQVGEVIELDNATYEPVPDTLRGVARELVRGVHKLPGRLLLLLDTDKVLAPLAGRSRRETLSPAV